MKRFVAGIIILFAAGLITQTARAADVIIKADGTLTAKMSFNGRVAIVAKSGGDYTDPATAMTNYSDWCPSPSDTNPCLLKIMPGVYNIGTGSVVMRSYIDIEGSGENVTIIQGTVDGSAAGVINATSTSVSGPVELRSLTVQNAGGSSHHYAIAVYCNQAYEWIKLTNLGLVAYGGLLNHGVYNYYSSPKMTNVSIEAWAGATAYGIYNTYNSYPTLNNVSVMASGGATNSYGVYNSQSGLTTMNSSIDSNTGMGGGPAYGVYNTGSSASRIHTSSVNGTTNSLYNNSGCTFDVAHSRITGGTIVANGGTFGCVGLYGISPATQRYMTISRP